MGAKRRETIEVRKAMGNGRVSDGMLCTQHVHNLVQMYTSQEDDLKWARSGMVARLINFL